MSDPNGTLSTAELYDMFDASVPSGGSYDAAPALVNSDDESANNYGHGDVVQDESGPDTSDYDYEARTGHRPSGDDDN
jgi:hypothetical protein